MKAKNVGMGIKTPENCTTVEDKNSPFSGDVKLRGRTFVGTVISAKMQKTATIEFKRKIMVKKYERYTNKRTRIKAHNPECIKAEEGDIVRIVECRPLSKTKNFVIVEKMGKEKGFMQKMEALEEGKKRAEKKEREEMKETAEKTTETSEDVPEEPKEEKPAEKEE